MQVFNRWRSQQTNVVPQFIHYAFLGGEFQFILPKWENSITPSELEADV